MSPSLTFQSTEPRFEFGDNWRRYLALVNGTRIAEAEKSLQQLLHQPSLEGKTFLDIGCGSGLFSLAAVRLGATVRSFDFDPQSVACAQTLRQRYAPDAHSWVIEQGSILDQAYVQKLGTYDIVYSWGVLHHTGAMWTAIESAVGLVNPKGMLAIALYNDQGKRSRNWLMIKKIYNALPSLLKPVYASLFLPILWGPTSIRDAFKGTPFQSWQTYQSRRGMSPWSDLVDWVGGLPFEVATPQTVIDFCRQRGLELVGLNRITGYGCNEYVFSRIQ